MLNSCPVLDWVYWHYTEIFVFELQGEPGKQKPIKPKGNDRSTKAMTVPGMLDEKGDLRPHNIGGLCELPGRQVLPGPSAPSELSGLPCIKVMIMTIVILALQIVSPPNSQSPWTRNRLTPSNMGSNISKHDIKALFC